MKYKVVYSTKFKKDPARPYGSPRASAMACTCAGVKERLRPS